MTGGLRQSKEIKWNRSHSQSQSQGNRSILIAIYMSASYSLERHLGTERRASSLYKSLPRPYLQEYRLLDLCTSQWNQIPQQCHVNTYWKAVINVLLYTCTGKQSRLQMHFESLDWNCLLACVLEPVNCTKKQHSI